MKIRFVVFGLVLAGLVLVLTLAACQSRDNSDHRASFSFQSYAPEDVWLTQEHDGGEVLSGDEVTHTFTLKNDLSTPLRIVQDADIVPNCGCAKIAPGARELASGDETQVTVQIVTKGNGAFNHGGRIVWTDPANKIHVALFSVRGVARPPIRIEPSELIFERADLARGQSKEIQVTFDPAVDRTSLSVTVPEKSFALEKKGSTGDKEEVYSIKCLLPASGNEDEADECVFTAKVAKENGGFQVSAKVVLYVQRAGGIEVQPNRLLVRFGADGRAVARCTVSGEIWPGSDAIEEISCPDYRVEWKPMPLGAASKATIIQLTLKRGDEKKQVSESSIQIKARGVDPVRVPIEVQE
jgi:hypothetical protein